ncbi:hypothetical protein [Amycolatopsis sp. NPDC051903]|uniref:AMP-binding enzyme n=1 Tax=Amycolatopsis sp. NPDC051903 TaxID=3363936 RepID=UPI00379E3794
MAEAAVVAVPHERWQERPFALVVLEPGRADPPDELLADLGERVPRWWLPEGVLVVAELPRTSVGKIDKKVLRAKVAAGGPWQGAG